MELDQECGRHKNKNMIKRSPSTLIRQSKTLGNDLNFTQITTQVDSNAEISSLAVKAIPYDTKAGDKFVVSGNELTIAVDANAGVIIIYINIITISQTILVDDWIIISKNNLFVQYQRKSEGTIAGFAVDADGLTKGGIEITDWLDSDTMTGASANNVPTAESVKAYVDANSGSVSNYSMAKCTTTTTTSATEGEIYAVVVPFDTELNSSTSNTIVLNGSAGVSGVADTAYSFYLDGATGTGQYELNWSVAINTNIVNNRILCGMQLQTGTITGSTISWTISTPSTSYLYNRGAGAIRKASASNSLFVTIGTSGKINYYRIMIWKEGASNASMNAITLTQGTQITMKKL